jgi:predicted Zn-dependent protease
MRIRNVNFAAAILSLAACAVNPVTGDRDLILLSGTQELAMGAKNYVPMQQSQGGPYDIDSALTRYVEEVGARVAAASGVDLPYEFVVLNNSVPNAWALPGGKIAINRGLLTEMGSEAELAAVLGHEVVHAARRRASLRAAAIASDPDPGCGRGNDDRRQ